MGRRNTKKKYYCPKCHKKTLVEAYNSATKWNSGWECTNQPPKKWDKLVKALSQDPIDEETLADPYTYEDCTGSYELRWGDDVDNRRAALQKKVRTYLKKRPPCDCVIFNENDSGRAKISDYTTVLDKLIRPGEPIMHHLIEKNNHIQRRGFQVLHSTDTLDVVRHNDDNGVAVWLYWKCCWDEGRSKTEIQWDDLKHNGAAYLSHGVDEQKKDLRSIFGSGSRFALWAKSKPQYGRLQNVPFTGNLGKKKKAEIIEWTKQLEASLRLYEAEAKEARITWKNWGRELRNALGAVSNKVSISGYNGKHQNCTISINERLTKEQTLAIAEILRTEPASS